MYLNVYRIYSRIIVKIQDHYENTLLVPGRTFSWEPKYLYIFIILLVTFLGSAL